jgi:ABC-type spermidine/putrescine transport system permease subunit I
LGAGTGRIFFRVVLPLIAPGVISGGIIAFIISFDEVIVASFLASGEQRTLPGFRRHRAFHLRAGGGGPGWRARDAGRWIARSLRLRRG